MSARFPAASRDERISRALASLRGVAVGDALGSQFFVPDNLPLLRRRELPPGTCRWTDDTEMAASVVAVLAACGRADQDALAASFARHHDFDRGYGPAVNRMLRLIRQEGGDWRELAPALFDGQGSWGNGGAMRVAPLGAWFADDPEYAADEAARSAEVTHRHPEAIAGTRAIAAATAFVAAAAQGATAAGPVPGAAPARDAATGAAHDGRQQDAGEPQGRGERQGGGERQSGGQPRAGGERQAGYQQQGGNRQDAGDRQDVGGQQKSDSKTSAPPTSLSSETLLVQVHDLVPRSAVQAGLRRALDLLDYADVHTVAAVLGCGRRTSTQDTVPFTLWAAARHLGDFREAIWTTAAAGGDVDTTCAIVGGIVAAGGPGSAPPREWADRTEAFPAWLRESLGWPR